MKSLNDIVKGLRAAKGNESQFISDAILEIKEEVKGNSSAKVNAIRKLCYLQMFGSNINWAAFTAIEVAALPQFAPKRIGYLTISQSFNDETEAIIMATNQFKKDLGHKDEHYIAAAINSLACVCTPELARDLVNDVVTMLNSSKTVVRRKSLLLAYRMLLRYPDALKLALPRLKDRLDDKEPSVQATAVTVMTELVCRNPSIYMAFAPALFKILTTPPLRDNWVLIKLVKCFGHLCKSEPRLTQRLAEPLLHLLDTSSAQSLVFEIVDAIVTGMAHDTSLLRGAANKLSSFIEDSDVNLQYLGLRGLASLLPGYVNAVRAHEEIILKSLEEADVSLRLRALEIVKGLATEKTLKSVVKRLLNLLEKDDLSDIDVSGSFRSELVKAIIHVSTVNDYGLVSDFEWLVSVFTRLLISASSESHLAGSALCEIVGRVPAIRGVAVSKLVQAIQSPRGSQLLDDSNNVTFVAYIIGEFFDLCPKNASILIPKLLDVDSCKNLTGGATGSLVDCVIQMVVAHANLVDNEEDLELFKSLRELAIEKLHLLSVNCSSFEGSARAKHGLGLLSKSDDHRVVGLLSYLFRRGEDLVPVSSRAQKKIQPPSNVNLDEYLDKNVEKMVTETKNLTLKDDILEEIPIRTLSDDDLPPLSDGGKKKRRKKKKRVKQTTTETPEKKSSKKSPENKQPVKSKPVAVVAVKPLSDDEDSAPEQNQAELHSALASVQFSMDDGLFDAPADVEVKKKKRKKRVKKEL
ncbi:hypothetical protein P9112_014203 [Eukaryota sp. TZLM1-RC]